MSNVMAIDIGGTKTALAVFDGQGRLVERSVGATMTMPPEAAIAHLVKRARQLSGADRATAIGLALPAIVADGMVVWAAPSVAAWQDVPAADLLQAASGLPAVVIFDGHAATWGEAVFGAGQGYRSLVTMIVGTGLGAGIWLDGRVIEGHTGVAGAVGWNRWSLGDGSLSEPAESVASGTGILRLARRHGRVADYPDTKAVFDRADSGDAVASAAIRRAAELAGAVAGQAIDLVAPELVVWGGGVGSRSDFSAMATNAARHACQPYAAGRTTFTRSRLGAESSLVGAAAKALSAREGEVTA